MFLIALSIPRFWSLICSEGYILLTSNSFDFFRLDDDLITHSIFILLKINSYNKSSINFFQIIKLNNKLIYFINNLNVRRFSRVVFKYLKRFENEIRNKVSLKMQPNITEEQCLVKFFKFFDLHNSGKLKYLYKGLCGPREWIKTLEKLGVVLAKASDIQSLFNYYDREDEGFINYKQFAHNIYSKEGGYNKHSAKTKNVERPKSRAK
jgi:hypothetical protein